MSTWDKLWGMEAEKTKKSAPPSSIEETIKSLIQQRDRLVKRRDDLVEASKKDRHFQDSNLIESLGQQIAEVEEKLKSLGSF